MVSIKIFKLTYSYVDGKSYRYICAKDIQQAINSLNICDNIEPLYSNLSSVEFVSDTLMIDINGVEFNSFECGKNISFNYSVI